MHRTLRNTRGLPPSIHHLSPQRKLKSPQTSYIDQRYTPRHYHPQISDDKVEVGNSACTSKHAVVGIVPGKHYVCGQTTIVSLRQIHRTLIELILAHWEMEWWSCQVQAGWAETKPSLPRTVTCLKKQPRSFMILRDVTMGLSFLFFRRLVWLIHAVESSSRRGWGSELAGSNESSKVVSSAR